MQDDRIAGNVAKMRAQGASDAEVEHYLANVEGLKPKQSIPRESLRMDIPKESMVARSESTRGLSRSRPGASGDWQALTAPGQGKVIADEVLPAMAALALNTAQGIPGMERAQAFTGSMGSKLTDSPMSYQESLQTLRGETEKIPSDLRTTLKAAGSMPLAALKPLQAMSAAKGGAVIGGADQLLSADEMGAGERAARTLGGAAVGAAAGKVVESGVTALRGATAPSLGKTALARKQAMQAADETAYGTAANEAVGKQTPQQVLDALNHPTVKPYAKEIRNSETFSGADDATVLREAFKLMSERQGMLAGRINNRDFKAGTSLEQRELSLAKERMLRAAEQPGKAPTPAGEAPRVEPIRDPKGGIRRDLSKVSDDELETEWHRLAERNSMDESAHSAIQEQGYRTDYNELPRTERLGRKGQEDLPDADGMVDGEDLLADNKAISQYNREAMVRASRERAIKRIEDEMATRANRAADPVASQQELPALMPSFRGAVKQHAKNASEREAFRAGADAVKRIAHGTQPAGRNLEKNSPEAFAQLVKSMTPAEAKAAREGALGALQSRMKVNGNPFTGFGVGTSMLRASKVSPYVRQLDDAAGTPPVADVLRLLGLSAVSSR